MLDRMKTNSGCSITFPVVWLFVKYPARMPTNSFLVATQSALPDAV